MQTTILLNNSVREQIVHECIQKKPNEACGFVWGTSKSAHIQAKAFTPVPNYAPDPLVQFSMDPMSLIPLLLTSSDNRWEIVGIVHSHPTAPAIPSTEDLQTSWHKLPSHWIVSLQQPIPYTAAYQYFHSDNLHIPPSGIAHYRPLPIILIQG